MRRTLSLVVLLACASLAPGRAWADTATETTAKTHYERGQKLFALQQFAEALDQFQLAFEAKAIPEVLFNIGQCHRNLGNYNDAIFSFKRYLQLAPTASNRNSVEKLIAQLEDKQPEVEAPPPRPSTNTPEMWPPPQLPPPPTAPPPPPPRHRTPLYKKWWFWTGAALVGAAGGFGVYTITRTPGSDLGDVPFGR